MTKNEAIIKGRFLMRPNRFLAIVEIDGEKRKAYVPNPGRMHELLYPGREVYLRRRNGQFRKTSFDVIGMDHADVRVSIDANLPNRFAKRALTNRELEWFQGYETVKPEPSFYNGRFDFSLEGEEGRTLIEVKSCTLVEDGHAIFPDAPSERAARHMLHLAKSLEDGLAQRAVVLFIIQRPDAVLFSPNDPTDPKFAEALRYANRHGVEILPLATRVVDWELEPVKLIDHDLNFYIRRTKE